MADTSMSGNGSRTGKRVYIGNLPPKLSREELQEPFRIFGKITDITMVNNSDRPYGFIEYENNEEAERAVQEMNGQQLNGYNLKVELSRSRKERNPSGRGNRDDDRRQTSRTNYRVVISGLSPNTSWQDLKDEMRKFNVVVTFTKVIPENHEGFAEFGNEQDMETVIEKLDGAEIRGGKVTVRRDDDSNRTLEKDPPARGGNDRRRGRENQNDKRRRPRSRSPPRRHHRSRERRRSRNARRSPEDSRSRRRDRDEPRGGRSRRGRDGSPNSVSGSRSPRRHRDSN